MIIFNALILLRHKGLYWDIDVKVRVQRQRSSGFVGREDGYELIRGEFAIGRGSSRRELVSGGPRGARTMMQPCASAAKLRGGGSNLNSGFQANPLFGAPHLGSSTAAHHGNADERRSLHVLSGPLGAVAHEAGRRTAPSGASPMHTKRHKAIKSFRARATIRVLRVPPRASAVRARYHCARALSFWNSRKRQASCTMPRRTRALPALARPFSRRLAPLSSGEPVRPA